MPGDEIVRWARAIARDIAGEVLSRVGVTQPSRRLESRLTIVTFHRVLPRPELAAYPISSIAVAPEVFRWFVEFFRAHFDCRTLSDAHTEFGRARKHLRPLLAITFDDGQIDNFLHARPILDELGVRATFFVPSDAATDGAPLWHDRVAFGLDQLLRRDREAYQHWVQSWSIAPTAPADVVEQAKHLDPRQRADFADALERELGGSSVPSWDGFMGAEELRALHAAGHEVGSHGASHELLPGLPTDRLEAEIRGSKSVLEAMTGQPVTSFCYPNGNWDDASVSVVRRAGYERAVTTAWGPNSPSANPFSLSRCDCADHSARNALGRLSASRVAWRISGLYPGLGAA
jgi:peptidoglycan/xylan/chitin deacetylase (PgdA/CDA1 family)